MAAKKKSVKKSAPKAPVKANGTKLNKSAFIRENPTLSVKDLVAKAKADHGVSISPAMVYVTRSAAKKGGKKSGPKGRPGPKPKAGRSGGIAALIQGEIIRLEGRIATLKAALGALND